MTRRTKFGGVAIRWFSSGPCPRRMPAFIDDLRAAPLSVGGKPRERFFAVCAPAKRGLPARQPRQSAAPARGLAASLAAMRAHLAGRQTRTSDQSANARHSSEGRASFGFRRTVGERRTRGSEMLHGLLKDLNETNAASPACRCLPAKMVAGVQLASTG